MSGEPAIEYSQSERGRVASAVGTGREIARHGRGEGKPAAPRQMRLGVGIGMGVPSLTQLTQGPTWWSSAASRDRSCTRPSRCRARERPRTSDEIDQGAHEWALSSRHGVAGDDKHNRDWQGACQALGVLDKREARRRLLRQLARRCRLPPIECGPWRGRCRLPAVAGRPRHLLAAGELGFGGVSAAGPPRRESRLASLGVSGGHPSAWC